MFLLFAAKLGTQNVHPVTMGVVECHPRVYLIALDPISMMP